MTETRRLQVQDLYRLRLISDPQISPDGLRVAFVLRQMDEKDDQYNSNIYVVDRDGEVVQFTSGNKDSGPRWSPDGRHLAFLSGRKEGPQIHLLPTHGGESIALTDLKHGAGIPCWSPDSALIAFTGVVATDPDEDAEEDGKRDAKKRARTKILQRASYKLDGEGYIGNRRRHLFLIDIAQRRVDQVTDGDCNDDDPAWSSDGRHLAFVSSRTDRWDVSPESDIYLMSRTGGELDRLTEGGAFGRPAFSTDGARLFYIGHKDTRDVFAPGRIYSILPDGQDPRDELGEWDGDVGHHVLSDSIQSHDVRALHVTPRPDGVYFIGSVRGECDVYRASDRAVERITQGRHDVSDFSVATDGTLAYARADPTHPSEIFIHGDGGGRRLTHENDDFLAEVEMAEPERFWYVGANGETNQAWLLAPAGAENGRHPLLAYIHGGPHFAHGETFFFEYQFLAGQGFGVFYPNIHGSAGYGRSYQTSINGHWGDLDYRDVIAGSREAASRDWVDPNRLGIVGGSYGGYMTIWTMAHSDMFRAGLAERCVSNLLSFVGTSDWGWLWNRSFGAYPEEDAPKLWEMSPIKHIANVQAPLMVMHYEGDDRTPLEQGEQVFVALRRLGKETGFIVFPEESHTMPRTGTPSRRVERLGYILDWFKKQIA